MPNSEKKSFLSNLFGALNATNEENNEKQHEYEKSSGILFFEVIISQ